MMNKMKKPLCFLLIFTVLGLSCKRWKYDEVKIHGKVINGTLNEPMAGEKVSLVEVKETFLGAGSSTTLKTVTTNSNGEYDFGGMDLRKKDKFTYYVNYVHRGISTDGFCDSYEVDKSAIDQNKNLVIFVGGGIVFHILPDMSVVAPTDSISIDINTSANFSVFYCNPNAVTDYDNKTHAKYTKANFFPDGRSSPLDGGDAYYYIKIKKVKAGISSTVDDTILIKQESFQYNITW